MQIYMKPRYGTINHKGHVVTLPHYVQKVADILPHAPSDIPILVFHTTRRDDRSINFKVR